MASEEDAKAHFTAKMRSTKSYGKRRAYEIITVGLAHGHSAKDIQYRLFALSVAYSLSSNHRKDARYVNAVSDEFAEHTKRLSLAESEVR